MKFFKKHKTKDKATFNVGIRECRTCENNLRCEECAYPSENETLKAEIERLKNCVKSEDEVMDIAKRTMEPLVKEITREQIDIAVKQAKVEAYKEFAERLKEKYPWKGDYLYSTRRTVENIDNLVKKMVGEQE